ncbi:hypothetical protein M885DRAFT_513211 [Pelagophyceae sp. CCMP2097]|nr:hypothetical protein M885DRAFT_513211 [Pelagophyceae sp. CCMP2097]
MARLALRCGLRCGLAAALLFQAPFADDAAVRSPPADDDAVRRCLNGNASTSPDAVAADLSAAAACASQPCPRDASFSRDCLDSRIGWRVPYARVQCCMRCCFEYWLRRYGLAENFVANGGNASNVQLLVGFQLESTMGFAARRFTLLDSTPDGRSRHPLKHGAVDPHGLWERALPPGAGAHLASPWVEAAFGDGCGGFAGFDFGKARRTIIGALGDGGLKELAANMSNGLSSSKTLSLVSSDDCETPDGGLEDLLDDESLHRWFTTNPSIRSVHPKLEALPIGARERQAVLAGLDGAEVGEDRDVLMCCCMAAIRPPHVPEGEYAGLGTSSSYGNLKPNAETLLTNSSLLLGANWRQNIQDAKMHSSLSSVSKRVRRAYVVEALGAAGHAGCHHGAAPVKKEDTRDKKAAAQAYVRLLLRHRFVASPNGHGRACHREWEALAAGAVPIVDYDASPAMAKLYEGLPVVRVSDWRTVTPAFLESEWRRIQQRHHRGDLDLKKLYLPHWLFRLTEHRPA